MTLHTLRRRSSKYALQVASLAHDLRMAADEREAGAAVIDFHIGTIGTILAPYLARQHEAKAQDQRAQQCADQPRLTQPALRIRNFHVHPHTNPHMSSAVQALRRFLPVSIIGNVIPTMMSRHT
jgi:hypothetical protein